MGDRLLVQYHSQQRLVDCDSAVVFDEAQFPDFVHENIHARTRRTHHARQSFLRNFRQRAKPAGPVFRNALAIARFAPTLFAGVKQLIDQIFFHANVMRQHVRNEMVGKFVLRVKHVQQLIFWMTSNVDGVTAEVVPIRKVCPAMHPSPKKSPGPNIATTASFPEPFTTDNFTPPFWMYITVSAASPWV